MLRAPSRHLVALAVLGAAVLGTAPLALAQDTPPDEQAADAGDGGEGEGDAPAGGEGDSTETGISPELDEDDPCGELAAEDCRRAGRSYLIALVAYDLGALLLALALYWVFSKRGSFRQLVNLFIPLLLFPAAATLLLGFDPMRDANFASCIACPDYHSSIVLSGMGDWPRALVLGAVPVAALYFVIVLIWNRLGK